MEYKSTRKERGVTQKLFLIETIETNKETEKKYVIMGSTGNVYDVTITNEPKCTCPDFVTRGNRCKHIYFTLLKIMKINNPDKQVYTDEELNDMFKNIPAITNALCVNEQIKNKYYITKSKGKDRITIRDDDLCPMCLDDIKNGEEYDYCKNKCGRCIHKSCFLVWCIKNPANCLICKTPWYDTTNSQYINLS